MAYWVPKSDDGFSVGNRPILPGQNYNDWLRNTRGGETGVYSNWSLQSSTQPLQDVGHPDLPDHSAYNTRRRGWQVFTGEFRYAPMELSKYSHGGQTGTEYLRTNYPWTAQDFMGVPSGEVFHDGDWGYKWGEERNFTFSRHTNLFHYGVPSTDATLKGQPWKAWNDENLPSYARRHEPYTYKGITTEPLEDGGENIDSKYTRADESNEHAFQRTAQWKGVPASRALSV